MPVNKKTLFGILFFVILISLSAVVFYTSVSCGMTLHKVFTQPHLEAADKNYSFLGFLFLAITNGAIALLSAAVLILLIIFRKKLFNIFNKK